MNACEHACMAINNDNAYAINKWWSIIKKTMMKWFLQQGGSMLKMCFWRIVGCGWTWVTRVSTFKVMLSGEVQTAMLVLRVEQDGVGSLKK